jgi:hypothetical protein
MRPARFTFAAVLMASAITFVIACTLNPQPLPPEIDPTDDAGYAVDSGSRNAPEPATPSLNELDSGDGGDGIEDGGDGGDDAEAGVDGG